ncbi:hypothetical protein [Clostridium scatologenes]|uniref:Dipeptidyl peptidase IV n=1 Tax=Clostridium scatologenes TaxID=1548 RepID=A0A0E3K298_CLOSL|nr:hypothetical protein [Clostridium scatologenes]AKA70608.1 hypothetical protein CSCA_3483 [Clostridium scatologenes]
MKGLKRILAWTMIPIVLEIFAFFFVDNFYLNDKTTFNAKKIDSTKKTSSKISFKVPDDAKDISASYNGSYVAYCTDGVINVVDTSNNKKKEIKLDDDAKLSAFKWWPNENIILIAEKYNDGDSSYLKFESYNAKKDEKSALSNEKNKELKISLLDSKYDVSDIAMSTASNVTYVKISKEGARSRLYSINVMTNTEETKYPNCKLGKIFVENKQDRLIYEDNTNNRIRGIGLKNPVATGENGIHYLLGIDGEDRIYIGNGENQKIKKIFVINLKKTSENQKYPLPEATQKSNIHITRSGKIYINDQSKNLVTEVSTGKTIEYKGTLVEIYNFGILSKNDGKIVNTLF